MNMKTIEQAAKDAVHEHCQCNGKYPCTERDYCIFCNGNNIAFDCDSTCDADVFNEGFIAGAHYVLLSSTHAVEKKLAEYTEEKNRQPCHKNE